MIEIKCPRCEQYWYDNDAADGRVRLCPTCTDQLRGSRGAPIQVDVPLLIGVAVSLVVIVVVIALTALWPSTFKVPMLWSGAVLCIAGFTVFRWLARGFSNDVDWATGRWALLAALVGLMCIIAALSVAAR
jgi:hypothetical protein